MAMGPKSCTPNSMVLSMMTASKPAAMKMSSVVSSSTGLSQYLRAARVLAGHAGGQRMCGTPTT